MATILLILIFSILTDNFNPDKDVVLVVSVVVFISIVYAIIIYRSIKKIKNNCRNYVLTVNDLFIVKSQPDAKTTIRIEDISRISESKNGTLCIRGKRSLDVIAVSPFIKEYDQLRGILYEIKPFETTRSDKFWQKFGIVFFLLPALLTIIVLVSENKLLISIGGTLNLVFYAWCITKIFIARKDYPKWLHISLLLFLLIIYNLYKMYFTFVS